MSISQLGRSQPTRNLPASTDPDLADPDPADPALADPALADLALVVKPRLRGWLHAGAAPLALLAGLVLIVLAPTPLGATGAAVFLAASVLLFGTSAIYHRGTWGPRGEAVLRRLDHANIYLFIAASYTPMALLLLTGGSRLTLLVAVWAAALVGTVFRLCWLGAPRWLYTALYLVMGWTALGWLGAFYLTGGATVLALILAGGCCYTAGAVVYGLKRPNPVPGWFGFHEIFHAGTLAGFFCHYLAISLIVYRAS